MYQQNFISLSYFLPEIILIISVLVVIISDLVPSLNRYSFFFTLAGIFLSALMLYMLGYSGNKIFNDMLLDD